MTPGRVQHLRQALLYLLRSKHADIEIALLAELEMLTRYLKLKRKESLADDESPD